MISALAVSRVRYPREQFNAYLRLQVHIPIYIGDRCTGTPHIYNFCCTEEAILDKKFILSQANHLVFEEEKY